MTETQLLTSNVSQIVVVRFKDGTVLEGQILILHFAKFNVVTDLQ